MMKVTSRKEFLQNAALASGALLTGCVAVPKAADERHGDFLDVGQRETDLVKPADYLAYLRDGDTRGLASLEKLERGFARMMDEIRSTRVTDTPAVWLVYNMGVIVKTRESLFSIDLVHRRALELAPLLDFRVPHTTLTFLGYDFRMVRDRLFGTGKRYLTFGPSKKSMKGIREKIHAITHARNGLLTVEKVVGRLNKLTKGWGAFYSVGYPSKAFHAVNGYALHAPQKLCFGGDLAEGHPKGAQAGARMARFLNRKSQRRYRLKFADTYYGELNHYGMYWLKWADVRRRRN